jgi:hypothetical protein
MCEHDLTGVVEHQVVRVSQFGQSMIKSVRFHGKRDSQGRAVGSGSGIGEPRIDGDAGAFGEIGEGHDPFPSVMS